MTGVYKAQCAGDSRQVHLHGNKETGVSSDPPEINGTPLIYFLDSAGGGVQRLIILCKERRSQGFLKDLGASPTEYLRSLFICCCLTFLSSYCFYCCKSFLPDVSANYVLIGVFPSLYCYFWGCYDILYILLGHMNMNSGHCCKKLNDQSLLYSCLNMYT